MTTTIMISTRVKPLVEFWDVFFIFGMIRDGIITPEKWPKISPNDKVKVTLNPIISLISSFLKKPGQRFMKRQLATLRIPRRTNHFAAEETLRLCTLFFGATFFAVFLGANFLAGADFLGLGVAKSLGTEISVASFQRFSSA